MPVHHHSEVVRFVDLATTSPRVVGHTFENCLIVGPAVIALIDSELLGCTLGAETNLEELLWIVDPENRPSIVGAVAAEKCRFVQCRFQGIGFAGPKQLLASFYDDMTRTTP